MRIVPPVAFLGIAERSVAATEGNTQLRKQHLLGLKQVLLSHIFPLSLRGSFWVFGFYDIAAGEEYAITIRKPSGEMIITFSVKLQAIEHDGGHLPVEQMVLGSSKPVLTHVGGWSVIPFRFDNDKHSIPTPGLYNVWIETA